MNNKNFKYWPFLLAAFFIFAPILLSSRFAWLFLLLLVIAFLNKDLIIKNLLNKINNFSFNNNNINMTQTIDINKYNLRGFKKVFIGTIFLSFIIWLFAASIVIVEAGEAGVYSLFGKVRDKELQSGFHLVIPLAKVTKMSVRTQEYTMSGISGEGKKSQADAITALTKEGLRVDLDITVLYRLDENMASEVYKTVGLDYEEKIIRPSIRTSIRNIIAQYEAKDIYSEKRSEAANKILTEVKEDAGIRGIIIEDALLRNIELPTNLAQSIQEKLQAEQEAEKYDFILVKERKEKERKIIEAEGQRDAQKIINESLSTNYLYYLYINELKNRAGTIYVPTGPNSGMPLFKDVGN